MDKKRASEATLRDAVNSDPKIKQPYGDSWDQVASSLKTLIKIRDEYNMLGAGRGQAFNSDLFSIARTLVRLQRRRPPSPTTSGYGEYSEAGLDSLKLQLFSEAPIYNDLETVKLADSLGMMVETMGADNGLVKQVLSPANRHANAPRN